jgi:hypothetical protein
VRSLIAIAIVLAAAAAAPRRPEAPSPVGPLQPLPAPARAGAGEPCLAVSPSGRAFLSWLEPRPRGGHALKLATLEGRRWSAPRTVAEGDSFFVNWADFPTLLAVSDTELWAHWPWKSGAGTYAYDVRIARSSDGGRTWSAPRIPHRDGTASEHGFVSLLADAGGVRAIWLDGRNAAKETAPAHGGEHEGMVDMTLRTAVLGADGTLRDEVELDPRVCDCCQTAATTAAGAMLVAYRDRSATEVRDISVVRREGGRWSKSAPIHADGWTIAGCPVNGPALEAHGDRVVAAWYAAPGDSARVLASFSDDGGRGFGRPQRVDQGDPQGRVDVVLLDDGSALVSWLENQGGAARILVRRVTASGAPGSVVTVARTSGARASGFPRMIRSGKRVLFAWTEAGKPSRVRTAFADLR